MDAIPLIKVRDKEVMKFFFDNIITRFGIPKTLVSDNGTQFDSKAYRAFCADFGIKNVYSTPFYPHENSQVEITNKTLLDGIKKRLDKSKGRWTEELQFTVCYRNIELHLEDPPVKFFLLWHMVWMRSFLLRSFFQPSELKH